MYARLENGIITQYPELPNNFNCLGGYALKSKTIHQADGFFKIEDDPLPDPLTHQYGELEFIPALKLWKHTIIPNNDMLLEITVLKQRKVKELKYLAATKLAETEWYYHREVRTGMLETAGKRAKKIVPESILLMDHVVYNQCDQMENSINALTTPHDILNYQIVFNI